MNHPEIPKDCSNFVNHEGVWRFRTTGVLGGFPIDRKDLLPGSRFTVACVAEVAWRKEAERFGSPSPSGEDFDRYHECCVNADAWRKWGEQ